MGVASVLAGCGGTGDETPPADAHDADTGQAEVSTEVVQDTSCPVDERAFCEPCTCDAQCGQDGVCLTDANGGRYCSHRCTVSGNECGPGSYCTQYGTTSLEFACQPLGGLCVGDGTQCAPCREEGQCQEGHVCHQSSVTNATDCYKQCTSNADCPDDHVCDGDLALCLPIVAGEPREVCHAGMRTLCEPCTYDYDCQSGMLCSSGICTVTCEKRIGLESTCPKGLFCVEGYCQPPVGHQCQGWLSCAYVCDDDEVCVKGFCKRPCDPDGTCPSAWQQCQDGYCVDTLQP